MIKRIENLYTLYNNVFEHIPIIYAFYNEYNGIDNDILLSYLILPLVLNEASRKKLLHSNSRSSIFTFCKDSGTFSGLSDMVKLYESITNDCIQYGIDNLVFSITEEMKVIINKETDTESFGLLNNQNDKIRAAEKFAALIKCYDIPTIYRNLGVVEL